MYTPKRGTMRRLSSSRWLAAGAAVFPTGAALAIAWLIHVKEAPELQSYWSWPGTVGAVATAVGFIMIVVGFVMPNSKSPQSHKPTAIVQHQSSGNNSINLQSGGDLTLRTGSE
jgi:hypothetical protein